MRALGTLSGVTKEDVSSAQKSASTSISSTSSEAVAEIAARVRRAAHSGRAKEVARLIAQGKEAYLHQGAREDCQAVCAYLDTRDALPMVCRARPPVQGKTQMRWRTGSTKYALGMDALGILRELACAKACGVLVRESIVQTLSAAHAQLEAVSRKLQKSSGDAAEKANKELLRGLAALELLCWGLNDHHVRAGAQIQSVHKTGSRITPLMGRVLHVDSLSGVLSYFPSEVCSHLFASYSALFIRVIVHPRCRFLFMRGPIHDSIHCQEVILH